jgi:hypothetical protein
VDRKILADLAVRDPHAFAALVAVAVGDGKGGTPSPEPAAAQAEQAPAGEAAGGAEATS